MSDSKIEKLTQTNNKNKLKPFSPSEDIFNSYFYMPLHGIAITSPDKKWIEVNEKLCSILGYTREEILKMTWSEITYPDDLAEDEKQFNLLIAGKIEHYNLDKRFIKKDKSVIWVNLSVGCVRDTEGKVNSIIALLEDITTKKNLENILAKEKQEQEIIFDSIPAWIFYKDTENRFIKVNKAFAEAMGKTKIELEGKSLFDIYPKDQAEQYAKDDKEVINSGKAKMNITEEIKAATKTLWVQTNKIPYRNELGNIIGIIGFTIDITDLKCAEDKLKSHTEEMEKFNKFMVNRELKMVELKEEIEKLKKQIKK